MIKIIAAVILSQGDLSTAGTSLERSAPVQVYDEGVRKGRVIGFDCRGSGVTCSRDGGYAFIDVSGGGVDVSGAPFITKTSDATLTNEFSMGSLSTGVVINTTTTGIPTIKGSNSCTNQFPRSDDSSGTWTCASIATADLPTVAVSKGGTGQTTITTNQVYVGTALDTLTAKTIPSCSNGITSKLLYDNSTQTFSCGTDQTGGGGSGNFVEVSISISSGSGFYQQATTGQAWVTATSKIVCTAFGTDADGLTVESIAIAGLVPTVSNLVVGDGFTLNVYSPFGLTGTVRFNCSGA